MKQLMPVGPWSSWLTAALLATLRGQDLSSFGLVEGKLTAELLRLVVSLWTNWISPLFSQFKSMGTV